MTDQFAEQLSEVDDIFLALYSLEGIVKSETKTIKITQALPDQKRANGPLVFEPARTAQVSTTTEAGLLWVDITIQETKLRASGQIWLGGRAGVLELSAPDQPKQLISW